MDRTKIYELIDKKLKQGQTIEEIYVEYDTLFTESLEKSIEEKTKEDREREDKYFEIKNVAAIYITSDALRKKGYIHTTYEDKKFGRWEKKEQ